MKDVKGIGLFRGGPGARFGRAGGTKSSFCFSTVLAPPPLTPYSPQGHLIPPVDLRLDYLRNDLVTLRLPARCFNCADGWREMLLVRSGRGGLHYYKEKVKV